MVSIQAVLSSTYHKTYIAKFLPSLTSQSSGETLLAVCISRQDGQPRHWCMLDRLRKEASLKADCCTFGYCTNIKC